MVNHQNTIQYRNSKQCNKSYTSRDTERKPSKPQRNNSSNQGKWNSRKYDQRIDYAPESKEKQQQNQHQCNRDNNQ